MYLTKMRTGQVQDAVLRNVPVVMAAGAVEYHGPHLPIGTDILITENLCGELERRCECVVAPSLPFAPTMRWAGGPSDGEIDFAPEPLFQYTKEILLSLIRIGFRRIYIAHLHQGSEGLQSLCLQRAAREAIRDVTLKWKDGWGRRPAIEWPNPQVFDWIRVAGIDAFSRYPSGSDETIPIGHAGRGETQLIMSAYPDTVNMNDWFGMEGEMPDWLQDADLATAEEGARWFEFCLEGWVSELAGKELR
jgi:creatinine amidohydrolase